MKRSEAGEVADFGGDAAGQVVVVNGELREAGEVADFNRDAAGQIVAEQIELDEIGEVADLCGDAARKIVDVEQQMGESGEPAVIGCDAALKLAVGEDETGDSLVGDRHARPVGDFLLRGGAGAPSARESVLGEVVVAAYGCIAVLDGHQGLAVIDQVVVRAHHYGIGRGVYESAVGAAVWV